MGRRRSWVAELALGAWSIAKGLAVTMMNALVRRRVTENYPRRAAQAYPRFRGRMVHKREEGGRPRCTACMACQRACPTLAIALIQGDEKKGREKRAAAYVWDASRCLFCSLCVEACAFQAIELGQTYSTLGESREDVRFELEGLLESGSAGGAG